MARKRVAGRFVLEGAETPGDEATGVAVKPVGSNRVKAPRPRYCRTFARARFAEGLPEITETLILEAKKGSVAHLKLLVQLSGLDKGEVVPRVTKRRGKSLEAVLMEEWRTGSDG